MSGISETKKMKTSFHPEFNLGAIHFRQRHSVTTPTALNKTEVVFLSRYNASSMDKSNGPAGTNLRPPVKQLRLQLHVHVFAGPA
jgi:hypothetical protein